jgi:glycosyltransferase involved in cell wall biosynthesis
VLRRFPDARARIRVIPHGVEPRFRPPESRDELATRLAQRFDLDAPYFLVVGQNTPSKNHAAVLLAFARAALDRRTRIVFLQRLYRERWLSPFGGLGALARRLGIQDRVVSLPGASAEEVVELIQGARALVQFSRYEGFGMPALEAMACGTPVIASDVPALCEVVGGAALQVPLVIRALSEALTRLDRDEGFAIELGARGFERSREFSWDRSAALHLEVFREAVTARSGSCSRAGSLRAASGSLRPRA